MTMRLTPLVGSLLLSSMLVAQHPTEIEPNDTVAQASTITVGTQTEAFLTLGETDWYTFTLAGPQSVRLDTNGVDTRVTLFDAAGAVPLAHDDDARTAANAWGSSLWLNLTAGTYTLRLVPFDPTLDTGPYSIDLAAFPTKVYTTTEVEPNDTYLTATAVPIPPGGALVHGNIGLALPPVLVDLVASSTAVLSDSVPAATIVTSKTVSISTTTVITPVGGGMTASAYIPAHAVIMTSGVNIGLIRAITANTATTITTAAWPVANGAGDTFDIITANTTTVTRATAALTASAFVPGFSMLMTSGANIGLIRAITANTTNTITTAAWAVANSAGDTFDVIPSASTTTVIRATTPLTASAYIGGLFQIRFTSGANAGLARQITANTITTITCAAFPVAPAGGDAFVVEQVETDYYQITLTAPRTGLWFLVNMGDAPAVHGHRWELYNNLGVLLLASSTTAPAFGTNAGNSQAGGFTPTSQIRVWPAGTYHIAIRSPSASFAAPNNVLPNGNYCLELFADMTIGTGATVGEAAEPNNTVAQATPLTFGQRGTGNISISTGADARDVWGPFTVPSYPCAVTFQSGRGTPTPIADTTVNLLTSTGAIVTNGPAVSFLTSTGALLAAGGSATTGNLLDWTSHARLTGLFTGGGTYYLEVVSPGTTTTTQQGDYVVEISDVGPAPYQTAAYTIVPANLTCGSSSVLSDIVLSSTTTVITATAPLVANAFLPGFSVVMTSGPNAGLIREITANTATTITTVAWPVANAAGNSYDVIRNALSIVTVGERPTLGALFSRNVRNCPPFGVGILMQGLTNLTANGGATPLPFDLGPFGAPGCTIDVDPVVTSFFFADGGGNAMVDALYPPIIALRGLSIFEQAAVLNGAVNTLGLQVSNYAFQTIGERSF